MQKSKFAKIFNICWKHVPFILCRSSQFEQMLYLSVNFDFWIMKKIVKFSPWESVEYNRWAPGRVGINIHGCQPYPVNCNLCTEICTILHTTVISFSDCTVTITQPFDVITSPGFPQLYQNGIDCTWNIQVPIGQLIQLDFLHFDVEYEVSCK